MIAAVDIGNSNIAIGLFEGELLTHHWRVTTRRNMTPDECEITLAALLRRDEVQSSAVDFCVLSSVVPSITQSFLAAGEALFGRPPLLVSPSVDVGMEFAIDNPRELGSDLFANAVAGYARYGGPCIVVDFGTALSVTSVGDSGTIMGVAIAPGINTALAALSGNAAQLPTVPLELPNAVIGTNTVHSIQAGIMHGYRGLVDALVGGVRAELGGAAGVIATGGQSSVLGPHCECIDTIDPWLTLDGLRRICLNRRSER